MIKYEKGKEVCTYTDVVSARKFTERLSNGEQGSNGKKY